MISLLQIYIPHFFAFAVGACIGSFLNVCAYRIPLDRSVVFPGSHCAACGAPIPPYYNIPILSWFWLRGRSACCETRIDTRYVVVEITMGLLFMGLWDKYQDFPLSAFFYAVLVSGLVVSSLIDLDHFIIPDRFTLGGCVAGVVACCIDPKLQGQTSIATAFGWSLASAMIGGLVLLAVAQLGSVLFRKEAMGFGDVKFAAAMCAFLGAESITWILPVSAMFGSVLGIGIIVFSKGSWGTRIPYGPFLALGAITWLFGGEDWMRNYWTTVIERIYNAYFNN